MCKQISSRSTDRFCRFVQSLTDSLLGIPGGLIDGLGNFLGGLLRCTDLPWTSRDQNSNENVLVSFGGVRPIGILITAATDQTTQNTALGSSGFIPLLVLGTNLLGIFLFRGIFR